MSDLELDQMYMDESFVSLINKSDEEKLVTCVNFLIENYNTEMDYDQIVHVNNSINALYGNHLDANSFRRQMKYLTNKGLYNRLSKKYRNDLIALGFDEDKVNILIELQKNFYENNVKKNENEEKQKDLFVKDFEIKTEMPVYTSNYKIKEENINNDLKKQNVVLNLNIGNQTKSERMMLMINKTQLINFYEQIEKIQENLDKLS